MLRFDLNISILLKEVPFMERLEYAARLGFGAVEFWWPGEENLSALVEKVRVTGLAVALINFDAGDLAAGERGFLNDPLRQERFRTGVPLALEFARRIGCPRLNVLVGNAIAGARRGRNRLAVFGLRAKRWWGFLAQRPTARPKPELWA